MNSTISVRVDEDVKRDAGNILKNLSLDMSTAINVYLKQVIRCNGIPFPLSANDITTKTTAESKNCESTSLSCIDNA